MRDSAKSLLAVLSVIVLAAAFWLVLLSPKRDKANELSEQAAAISAELASDRANLSSALAAKRNFPSYYGKLVSVGKAVPSESGTASLLVQLEAIARRSKTSFASIGLGSAAGGESSSAVTGESGASQLPLGAAVGAAGLPAMPYSLEFEGGFFEIADFIKGLDSLVETKGEEVEANGRLVTIDGFTLTPVKNESGPQPRLKAVFQVTTYVAPSGEGLTAGAPEGAPETVEATAVETTP